MKILVLLIATLFPVFRGCEYQEPENTISPSGTWSGVIYMTETCASCIDSMIITINLETDGNFVIGTGFYGDGAHDVNYFDIQGYRKGREFFAIWFNDFLSRCEMGMFQDSDNVLHGSYISKFQNRESKGEFVLYPK